MPFQTRPLSWRVSERIASVASAILSVSNCRGSLLDGMSSSKVKHYLKARNQIATNPRKHETKSTQSPRRHEGTKARRRGTKVRTVSDESNRLHSLQFANCVRGRRRCRSTCGGCDAEAQPPESSRAPPRQVG